MFDVTVYNFSGIYELESFYLSDKSSRFIDLKELPGCNCMCDDEARKEIMDRIIDYRGLHFIDSGNYHYMSALFLSLVKEPFSLVVLDHHPDMQRPMFDILSCGGWVMDVLDNNPFVRDVHIIGADKKLISQMEKDDRVRFYELSEVFGQEEVLLPDTGYPVYLSVDKDVMSKDEIITNWDQGEALRSQVLSFIKKTASFAGSDQALLGVDICGECAADQEDCNVDEAVWGNDLFNKEVMAIFR
ncbi:MAG: hypothetical protein K6G10_02925 [Butyrivibrio sp.]|nr:hypothetical protein [Butyrivibrio sp.]